MLWSDSFDIAIALQEKYPNVDPLSINFVELCNMVCTLDGFNGKPDQAGEKILEAIQMCWLDEID